MNQRFGTGLRGFAIALLAQVVLCLVTSPILSAQQWATQLPSQQKDKSSKPANVTIQAAVDAENVRPEEISEAGQKRGKFRPSAARSATGICRVRRADHFFRFDENGPHGGPYEDFKFAISNCHVLTSANFVLDERPIFTSANLPATFTTGPPTV